MGVEVEGGPAMNITARQLLTMTDDQAREMLERIRWPHGPVCPHCGSQNVARLNGKATRPGVHKCREKGCRRQFTATVGTVFHRSHIGLGTWIYATWRICSSKKGISAHQLHRETGLCYKSVWFMCHRIRHAMSSEPLKSMLSGTVESDESYIGGKPRPANNKGFTGRQGQTNKTPVHVLVERDGSKRTRVLANVTASNLRRNLRESVDCSATIMTDESSRYHSIRHEFDGGHKSVDHSRHEYYRHSDGASTNTAESSFALIKRGMYGTFHHVSTKHLQRYCDEFDFRWEHRGTDDVSRTIEALKGADGKRLTYRTPAI